MAGPRSGTIFDAWVAGWRLMAVAVAAVLAGTRGDAGYWNFCFQKKISGSHCCYQYSFALFGLNVDTVVASVYIY